MAWYAELCRRRWYCINGFDAISWYTKYLYDEWWNSLTDEQRERVELRRKQRAEKAEREFKQSMFNLLAMTTTIAGVSGRSIIEQKYHGIYDEFGFPKV